MKKNQIILVDASTIDILAKLVFLILIYYMLFGELPIGKIRFPLFILTLYILGKVIDLIENLRKRKDEFSLGSIFKERR